MKIDKGKFYEDVYSVVDAIPPGKVLTYGEIALLIGWPQHSRMVGRAMSLVPPSLKLPCHRVVHCGGRLVTGWTDQRALLEKEGVVFRSNGNVNVKLCKWDLGLR